MSVKIFFCYAREDEALLSKLKTQLRPLQRQGLIDIWYDRDISPGAEWEHEINKHLDAAQIILLLISPDFMNSDYCYGTEMQQAIKRHERGEAQVIPDLSLFETLSRHKHLTLTFPRPSNTTTYGVLLRVASFLLHSAEHRIR